MSETSGRTYSSKPNSNVSPLPAPVDGERMMLATSFGNVAVFASGEGPALLLIHSVNAAASAAEVRPLHEHFSRSRRVFSIDLPGYGLSHRADVPYSSAHMTEAIHETVSVIQQESVGAPVDALGVSLGAEFLARAAVERPASFRSLALVSPTGFSGSTSWEGAPGSTRGMPLLYACLRGPGAGWGRALFRQLTRPKVIRYFLERTWGDKNIDEQLWRYDILTTRQPNAEFAPLRFLAGFLFSADIHSVYEALTLPVWMSHGIRGDFTDYRNVKIVQKHANWQFTTYPTGALPYFELPQQFNVDYERFLAADHSIENGRKAI